MAIKIVVDTKSRSNPSNNKREYVLNTHPLFKIDNVTDILKIEKNVPKITRNIGVNENGTIYVLDKPYEETFNQLKLELFKGANYIYIENVYNNDMTLEYLVDSDMNNNYVSDINFGTKITQNSEAVQIAWNQISQYIKFEGIDDKASFAIYDENNQQLMVMNQYGMNFFANNEKFGDMGVHTIGDKKYIAFSVDGEYGETATNGMAWGVTTKSDKAFKPIFYIENFDVAPEASDAYYGQLVLGMCDLVLAGANTGIVSGNIKITGDDLLSTLAFTDINTDSKLLEIFSTNSIYEYIGLKMLDGAISFFKNKADTNSFKIGISDSKYCLLTDNGDLYVQGGFVMLGSENSKVDVSIYPNISINVFGGNIDVDGNVYADNISSDERLKNNIEDSKTNATENLNKFEIKSFDWKKNNSHIKTGFIAQQLEKIDEDYVLKKPEYDENKNIKDYKYYINELPILATLVKGFQEQQQQIKELQRQINELKGEK